MQKLIIVLLFVVSGCVSSYDVTDLPEKVKNQGIKEDVVKWDDCIAIRSTKTNEEMREITTNEKDFFILITVTENWLIFQKLNR
jgi:hypothetical protein